MPEIDMVRNNPHLDPVTHIWGWEVPVYLFLGGVTAGVMILSALLAARRSRPGGKGEETDPESGRGSAALRLLPFLAPLLLSGGMLFLFIDLESRLRAYRFYLSFQLTSPMSWGAWILIAVFPVSIALGLAGLSQAEISWIDRFPLVAWLRLSPLIARAAALAKTHLSLVRQANIVLGVSLGAYTGLLLGTLAARAAWNSGLMGPLFLVSGVSTGAAFIMLLPISQPERESLRRWDMAAIALELVLLLLFLLDLGAGGGSQGLQAAGLFLGGPYTAVFWSLVVIGGLLVPLILEVLESSRERLPTSLAPVLLLVGGLALRFILVAAGQA